MADEKDIFADENLLAEPVVVETTEEKKDESVVVEETNESTETSTEQPTLEDNKDFAEKIIEEPKIVQPEPLKFANEASEKMYNLLKEGKEDEIRNHLNERKLLSEVGNMKSEDAIKLKLQKEHPNYSHEDIQDIYEDKYSLPEKPEQRLDETDQEFELRTGKWQKSCDKTIRSIERSAQEAKEELSKQISEIVLPDISVNVQKQQEYSQEELAKIEQIRTKYVQSLQKGFNEFNGYKTTYKDEEVEIPVEVNIPLKEKTALKERFEQGFDFIDYMQKRYFTKDGIDGKKLMDEIFLLENREKVFANIANEAGSKRHNEQIRSQHNIKLNSVGNKGTVKHEIDHEMKMAEAFFGA